MVASHVSRNRRAALQTSLEGVPAATEENHAIQPARPTSTVPTAEGHVSSVKILQTCPYPRAALARDVEDRQTVRSPMKN